MAEDPELEDLLGSVDPPTSQTSKDDPELTQLLDSALKEFPSIPHRDVLSPDGELGATSVTENFTDSKIPEEQSSDFSYLNELLTGFANYNQRGERPDENESEPLEMDYLKNLLQEDPEMMGQFEQLAQAACKVDESETSQQEFSNSLTSTLTALTQNMESLQGQLSEEEMMAALSGLNLADQPPLDAGELRDDISLDGDDDPNAQTDSSVPNGPSPAFLPMLGGMMRSILSKEVLYPSLLEIANIYPAWLEENREKLPDEDFVRFEKQYIVISQVCRDFEEETESSGEEEKQTRFERVLIHMQKMHELGQPPKELLLKLDPSMEAYPGNVPMMPRADQCNLM